MSAMERTTYRLLVGSNAWTSDALRTDPHRAPCGSELSTDLSSDDPLPLFLSDPRGQPDPREFAPLATSQRTSILSWIVAGGLVISAFAILVAVSNSDVTRLLSDKARIFMGGATTEQSATEAASNQPAVPQDSARIPDPVTLASADASAPPSKTPSHEAIVSAYRTAQQSQAPAAPIGNEAAAPSKTLDPETLAALMARAKRLLTFGDIPGARLLLERAANAEDATAAFLLAQTYDPAVLGVRDPRSITPDPGTARDWYCKAASFGSADAQQRLTQLQSNLHLSGGCHVSAP